MQSPNDSSPKPPRSPDAPKKGRDDQLGDSKATKSRPNRGLVAILVLLGLAGALWVGAQNQQKAAQDKLDYAEFISRVRANLIKSATINNDTGIVTGVACADPSKTTDDGGCREGRALTSNGPRPASEDDVKLMRDSGVAVNYKTITPSIWASLLPLVFVMVIIIGFYLWMSRRAQGQMGSVMNVGRSKAKMYTTERPKTTFADVAGYTGVKTEIREVVDFLKTPQRFRDIGAKIPKGVLLVGPPGTGKTLLARAVAGEAGVPFLSITGSDFMEMFVGVGASRVRDLFQTARKNAPAIIFIDEIDSIGRKRGAGLGGGHDEREQTLNQMLSEMDGFEASESVVIIAATNRPDILDPALLRPGRFDRQVAVELPDFDERLPILEVHCQGKRLGGDVDLRSVARGTPGMSGADLANLINEAALHAVRRGATEIYMEDIDAARDRVLMGQLRDSMVLSDHERESTAYHEGGHALLGYVLPNADPVHKVTIIPRGFALGVTQSLPAEDRHAYDTEYFLDRLCMTMGGRCAEKLIYGTLTTGAANDLQSATELARRMVTQYGMSDRIGPQAWSRGTTTFLGDDMMQSRDYSSNTEKIIDEEVERLLRSAENRADEILSQYREGLELLAKALLEHETVDGATVESLIDTANGGPVHPNGKARAPRLTDN